MVPEACEMKTRPMSGTRYIHANGLKGKENFIYLLKLIYLNIPSIIFDKYGHFIFKQEFGRMPLSPAI